MSNLPVPQEVVVAFQRKQREHLIHTARQPTFEGFRAYFQLVFNKPMPQNMYPAWEEYYKRFGYRPVVE